MAAAAAVLAASDDQLTRTTMEFKINVIPSWGSSEKDHMFSCYNLLVEIEMEKSKTPKSIKRKLTCNADSDKQSPPKIHRPFIISPTISVLSPSTSLSFSPTSPHHFAVTHSATVSIFSSESLTPKATISAFKDTVKYPRLDKLHLFFGADDVVVKYWDVALETPIHNLVGHKDYVCSSNFSPASDDMFITGAYDHTVRVWDVRVSKGSFVIDFNHGKPVEDVIYLPSGG